MRPPHPRMMRGESPQKAADGIGGQRAPLRSDPPVVTDRLPPAWSAMTDCPPPAVPWPPTPPTRERHARLYANKWTGSALSKRGVAGLMGPVWGGFTQIHTMGGYFGYTRGPASGRADAG